MPQNPSPPPPPLLVGHIQTKAKFYKRPLAATFISMCSRAYFSFCCFYLGPQNRLNTTSVQGVKFWPVFFFLKAFLELFSDIFLTVSNSSSNKYRIKLQRILFWSCNVLDLSCWSLFVNASPSPLKKLASEIHNQSYMTQTEQQMDMVTLTLNQSLANSLKRLKKKYIYSIIFKLSPSQPGLLVYLFTLR